MSRGSRCLLLLAAGLSPGAALAAPVQLIAEDSTLHRVEATFAGKPAVSVLRHTRLGSNGTSQVSVIPGTDDAALDFDPALAVDPVGGFPVLAWTRDTGTGADVYVSRFDGAWSWPVLALSDPGLDEVLPQIQISTTLVHVVARDGAHYVRVSLDRETLQPVFGPEVLPTAGTAIRPGVDPPAQQPSTDLLYFASDVLRLAPDQPSRVVIWGVRDEPVPIGYVEVLQVPDELLEGSVAQAAPIEGRLTVTATSGTRAWYALFQDAAWREFSAVELDGSMTLSDVRSLLADMIRRGAF